MSTRPVLSLIVPTRGRPQLLRNFLASVAATASRPDILEVVLVVDSDDPASEVIDYPGLNLRRLVGPPGRTMGQLNIAGYEASVGQWVMLLNDDVTVRTAGWDDHLRDCFAAFPDGLLLVHVNDRLFESGLCVFPVVSRAFCELTDGICPRDYIRYRIDDHIEDVFNLLAVLGEKRSVYLPDIVFEHGNHHWQDGAKRYCCDQDVLTVDARRFEALLPQRKELAIRLKARIAGDTRGCLIWQRQLEAVRDSFALRTPGRQHIWYRPGLKGWLSRLTSMAIRAGRKVRRLAKASTSLVQRMAPGSH